MPRYQKPPSDANKPFIYPDHEQIIDRAIKLLLDAPTDGTQLSYARALVTAAGTILRMSGSDFQTIHAMFHNCHPLVRELVEQLDLAKEE